MNNMDNLDGDKIIEEAEKSLERLSRKIEHWNTIPKDMC